MAVILTNINSDRKLTIDATKSSAVILTFTLAKFLGLNPPPNAHIVLGHSAEPIEENDKTGLRVCY